MQNPAFRAYLENKILTATPNQLQLMLYEGLIRFAQVARLALEEQDYEKAQDAFERADAILTELIGGLRPERDAALCDRYLALYNFCYRRLTEANFQHSIEKLDDAIKIMQHLRETWVLVMEQIARDNGVTPAGNEPYQAGSLAVST